MLSYTDVSVYLIISLLVDERKIDVRKPAKVPKGQEGESLKSPHVLPPLCMKRYGMTVEVVMLFCDCIGP